MEAGRDSPVSGMNLSCVYMRKIHPACRDDFWRVVSKKTKWHDRSLLLYHYYYFPSLRALQL